MEQFWRPSNEATRFEDALTSHQQVVDLERQKRDDNPRQLVKRLYFLGETQREIGAFTDAAASYKEAAEIAEQLIDEKLSQSQPLDGLALEARLVRREWAGTLHELRRHDELESMLKDRLSRRKGRDDPGSLMDVADFHVMLGLVMDATERSDDASAQYRMAIAPAKRGFELAPEVMNLEPWSFAAFMLYRRSGWVDAEKEANIAIDATYNIPADAPDYDSAPLMFAPLYWLAGQEDEYRRICRKWVDSTSQPPDSSVLVRMACLDPSCLNMGNDVLTLAPEVSPESSKNANESYGSLHHARGRAQYRTGNYEQSIDSLRKASDRTGAFGSRFRAHPPDALVHLDLALAHHFNGEPDLAKHWLGKATQEMDSNELPWLFCESLETVNVYLPYQLFEMEILRREAERLILDSPKPGHAKN